MALFPAFEGSAGDTQTVGDGAKRGAELDWLSNRSFHSTEAETLHRRILQPEDPASAPSLLSRSPLRSDVTEESVADEGTKKSSKKKKKKHKHLKRKKTRKTDSRNSESSSETEPVKDKAGEQERGAQKPGQSIEISDTVKRHLVWLEDIQSVTGEAFRIDKNPDPANWEYKSIYRAHIARYKRKGNSCLGINPKKQWISWEDSGTEKKQLIKRAERYFTKSGVRLLATDGIPVCSRTQATLLCDPALIPLQEGGEGEKAAWVNPLGVYDASTTLWLQGKGVPESEAKQPPSREDLNHTLKAKVEEFNRKLRESPGDVQAWMAFVDFQDELLKGPSMYTTNERELESGRKSLRLVLEKKLCILERAIESNPHHVELKLARLKLCEEFWEPAALLKEWQKLVFLHPNNAALWQKYLLFSQSQFSTFSVSKVISLYGKCLSTLAAVQDGSMVSHPVLAGTEEAMFAIFLQQCHFLRQAGQSEKAVALFQAMSDFTFFKPDSLRDVPTKRQVEFFEPFWDSGEPRFGERGAKGWNSWMRQQERGGWVVLHDDKEEEEDDVEDEPEIEDKTRPKWQIWLEMECAREAKHWLPWRPSKAGGQSEEDCEDPERQVVFDELGPSLFRISSPELKFQLMDAFLQFLGVPCGHWLPASGLYLAMDENSVFDSGHPSGRPLTPADCPLSGLGTLGHMATLARGRRQVGHAKEGEEFLQSIFQLALTCFSGEEKSHFSVCWLQYEISKAIWYLRVKNKKNLKSQGKKSKKLAKRLLKEVENRNSLPLWREYARLEWLLGNADDSRKVFDTAISLAGSGGLKSAGLCSLCLLYAELEVGLLTSLEGTVSSRAVHVLTKLADSAPYVPYNGQVLSVGVLKARKVYEHAVRDCLQEGCVGGHSMSLDHLVSLVGCFALFQYLTVGVEAAVQVFGLFTDKASGVSVQKAGGPSDGNLETRSSPTALETLSLMHANLLRYHLRVGVHPLSSLRETLTGALRLYPGNQLLWKSYVEVESKLHNASKARKFFDNMRRSSTCLEPWLFAIQAEQARKKLVETVQRQDIGAIHATIPETGLTNRIKALFEHAVRSQQGAHCPLLWRMYLHFMVSSGEKEGGKGLFYKALQSCPWAKVLYMDAIDYFPDQLQEILDLMVEKELRVRVPLEELELLLED
ncbi:protein NRDE2 homolog isoform X2 [Rhinatrema bivittatum]|uniref:protein NRDE2 homolog isoform X2 n=1 Tax=Rhinatrema bivittatum TaxID=194408 RepID=UPI00112B405E|nr:protein NRDE2 homolog isoform X2 [Rhinatrema bivittatum]